MDHSRIRLARTNRRRFVGGTTLGAVAVMSGILSVNAQDASPAAGEPPAPTVPEGAEIEVLATGLLSPRFIAIENDTVYFTEAGSGGETAVFATPGPGTPEAMTPISGMGTTGKLSSIGADGTVSVVAEEFTSYTFGEHGEIVGPAGLALDGAGKAYVAVGAPGPFVASIPLTGDEGSVFEVDLETGEKTNIANLLQYEIDNDPDPMAIDSNLYGAAFKDGVVYVADAGGNDILAIDIESGDVSTFAVTGGLDVPGLPPEGNPMRGGEMQIDSVPSGLVFDEDGNLYVSFVTGGPFPAGISPVHTYSSEGELSEYATGLTMVASLAFASDGMLYASVLSADFLKQAPGQVVRVSPEGNHEVVVDGLMVPNGIAFDTDDNLYVVNKTSGFPDGGELLKVTGVVGAAGTTFMVPEPAA